MHHEEERALKALATLRRVHPDSDILRTEYLAIKAEVLFDESYVRDTFPNKSGVNLYFSQMVALVGTWASFKRLSIGCCVM